MGSIPTTYDSGQGFGWIGYASGLSTGLMDILNAGDIVPGSAPSYQTCKDIYAYHPLGGKMSDGPITLAQSQERELTVPTGPEEELIEAFQKEWNETGRIGADEIIHQAASLSRIYGISTLVLMADKIDLDKPIPAEKLYELDLTYNILDPLNTAGSLIFDQDPTHPDFMKPRQVTVRGRPVHMSRVVVTMNEQPIWIEWTDSAFGFVGRSVYQRALYPMKSYIQGMLTDNHIMEKAGVLVHKAKGPGSIIDKITHDFFGLKRSKIQGTKTGNVVTIGNDEELTSIDLTNLQQAAEYARNNIVTNIATSADMPASLLREETYTQGFGEGTEDAKRVSNYIGRMRIKYNPLYKFMDDIVMRRAWNPGFYETIQRNHPEDYGKVPFETAFFMWKNSFKATWPNLIQEPDSEKSKVDDVIMKAAIASFQVLAPVLDPENKARAAVWLADVINERKLMFSSPLLFDEEAIAAYEPPTPEKEPSQEPEHEPESYRDSRPSGLSGNDVGKLYLAMRRADKEFRESDHPRDEEGKFSEGGGGATAAVISSFAKKTKSKITPTKQPPGSMLEIKAGIKENFYEELMTAADKMYEGAQNTHNAHAGGYIKRSIEIGAEDKKYNVSVQLDSKGDIIGAVSMHLLPDSIRIETLGGVGKGAGKSCLISAVKQSIKAGKGGAITLTPIASSIGFYVKMGFDSKANSRFNELWLSSEKAKKLLEAA